MPTKKINEKPAQPANIGKAAPAKRSGYHHGDLRQALLQAAEQLLAERGLAGFTLRECARRVGVSPAAPSHHFGSVHGLLTAIAISGFEYLAENMEAVLKGRDWRERLKAMSRCYLDFAYRFPARFKITFSDVGVDKNLPAYQQASERAFLLLECEVRAALQARHIESSDANLLPEVLRAWSTLHGYAILRLDGKLKFLEGSREDDWPSDALSASLLNSLLDSLQ
jgi:AcrR family transcriptional regulator